MSSSHARTPPPRPLGNSETLETLTHWRTTFKTFYKRDESYRFFVKETTKWDPSNDNYNQIAEGENGLKRTAADMKEDLIDLLNTLAGYLPHSYLTDKIVSGTKGWQDVWNVIYDHYGVQISSESLLDFESMHKQPGETHRQFYERLLQHVKQHLAPADVKVEQVRNTVADTMSISLMNMTALQWMRKTSGSLIDIVRTEYSTELRDNVQLAELVPRIALNVDSLLQRYNKGAATNKVSTLETDAVDDANINKTWGSGTSTRPPFQRNHGGRAQPLRGGSGRGAGRGASRGAGGGRGGQDGRSGPFCPGCYYLSQQLATTIHFRHTPADCPRKAVTVKMFQMEDNEHFEDGHENEDEDETFGKIQNISSKECLTNKVPTLQIEKRNDENSNPITLNINVNMCPPLQAGANLSSSSFANSGQVSNNLAHDINISDKNSHIQPANPSAMETAVNKLQERHLAWNQNGVRKEKSPMVFVTVNNKPSVATIDEGSEINCLDEGFATRTGLEFVPTACTATAAGSNKMKLAGQTIENVGMKVEGASKSISWELGKMVVVRNLGVDILVGEPGKADNKVVTIPHKKVIEVLDDAGRKVVLPYCPKNRKTCNNYAPCKAMKNEVIFPDESIVYELPPKMQNESVINISPRRFSSYTWLEPRNINVQKNGTVLITNETDLPVHISKNEHFAYLRTCSKIPIEGLKDPSSVVSMEESTTLSTSPQFLPRLLELTSLTTP